MAKRDKRAGGKSAGADARTDTYKGHEIVYPSDERRKKIFIDGRPVRWGVANGTYYLDVYAYDRGPTLEDTVKRYIAYLDKTGSKPRKEVR